MMRLAVGGMVLILLGSDVGWSIDGPADKVPDGELRGEVFGRTVETIAATYDDGSITTQSTQKVKGWPAWKLIIFAGKEARAREILVTPKSEGMLPHIHMNTAIEGRGFPGTLMYTEMYSMRLVAKEGADGLQCGIHLSLPDYKHTHLAGIFTARKQ